MAAASDRQGGWSKDQLTQKRVENTGYCHNGDIGFIRRESVMSAWKTEEKRARK
jgi:hypothetical protein